MNEKNKTGNHISSGNTIVDKLGQMDFTGNIVNPNWNYHVTNENNKPNYLAVQILAEIVYWTRPSVDVDNKTGIAEFKKKFSHGDYYQVCYSQLEEKFNCTLKQAQSAMKLLFETGVIIQHLINDEHGTNQMYLEVVPEILHRFNTEEKDKRNHRKDNNKIEVTTKTDIPSPQKEDEVYTKKSPPNDKNVMTYTDIIIENKEENNTETTTITGSTPDRIAPTPVSNSCILECGSDKLFNLTKELFAKYNLSDKDISEIISIAQSDFNRITKAHKVIVNYKKPISSIMGFLRNAILNNWESDVKSTVSNSNDYYLRYGYSSWEELEAAWINECNK